MLSIKLQHVRLKTKRQFSVDHADSNKIIVTVEHKTWYEEQIMSIIPVPCDFWLIPSLRIFKSMVNAIDIKNANFTFFTK